MADGPLVFELRCGVQQYEWGKLGKDSEVAALKSGADPQFKVDNTKKYAELWMGTHVNCPSTVVRPGHADMSLEDWIRDNPDCLGSEVKDYFKGALPFLFKVLSVRTSLSIQAHPNKENKPSYEDENTAFFGGIKRSRLKGTWIPLCVKQTAHALTLLPSALRAGPIAGDEQALLTFFDNVTQVHAEQLHAKKPGDYKDPNHKPEMAIALTPFLGLCGFRPIQELAHFIANIIELRTAVGDAAAMKLVTDSKGMDMPKHREALKECFRGLMENKKEVVTKELQKLVERIQDMEKKGADLKPLEGEIILKLHSEFPGDPGAFCVYFMNVVRLQAGEAMFLKANLPHAYLSGDCMECMACSDNVVRAGLTPKKIDKETLIEMLDYTGHPAEEAKFRGVETAGDITTTIFRPPVRDFGVSKFEVPEGVKEFTLNAFESASICIVIRGKGLAQSATLKAPLKLCRGTVFFVAAQQEVRVTVLANQSMLLFQAYAGLLREEETGSSCAKK